MSELEEPFILLEPSCDIHLALISGLMPPDEHHVPLRVFRGVWDPVARRHVLTVLRDDVELDWFGLGGVNVDPASIVTIEPPDAEGRRRLTPRALGQVLVQVRYMDPERPNTYDYLIARIWVHDAIDGWWFGHQRGDISDQNSLPSVSVFADMELAHTQPTVLALFDETSPGGGVVADISGHGYVRLTSADPAICAVDTTYSGRLRGVALGETQITGRLDVIQPDVPVEQQLVVRVVDPHLPPNNTLSQVCVDEEVDPRSKLNVLFLCEGFTAPGSSTEEEDEEEEERQPDRERFEEAVLELSERLFDDKRHEPFHLLRDQFNVWTHYEPWRHRGLTPGPQLTMPGVATAADDQFKTRYIPQPALPLDKKKPGYSLKDLLLLVGLPGQDEPGSIDDDVAARVAQLRAMWRQAGSLPSFLGYDDDMATPEVVTAWTHLRSRGIPNAIDTLYGLMQGSRWGDRESRNDERADMISQPLAGASEEARVSFARHVHQWFDPQRAVRSVGLDPRRYAPEYHLAGWNLFARFVGRLIDRRDAPGSDDRLGRVWDANAPVESSGDQRRRSSAGLVCVLVNARRSGATAHHRYALCIALGRRTDFPQATGGPSGRIRRLDHGAGVDYKVDHRKLTDKLAHELGHSYYGFGDEYESERGAGGRAAEQRDNLTHADTVREEGTIETEDFPTPIDPERIKWAFLHRIEKADTVVRPTEIGPSAGPGRSKRIIVTLAAGRAETWRKALEEEALIYLRRLKETPGRRRQLPITDDDLYEELTIESIPDDRTLHLFADAQFDPQPFPAGSVIYLPRLDPDSGMPLTLVHEKVLEHMRTTRLPLTENHFSPGEDDPDDGKFSDPVNKKKDVPPRIAGFARPCQEHKLLGLYEGGYYVTRMVYRPSGACKMRSHEGEDAEGEFCFVCKYLQVNLVDPARHAELDALYPRPSWLKKFLRGDG